MAAARTPPPPPVIGKAGSYTVFITPQPTPPCPESARSDIVNPLPNLSPESARKEPPPVKAPTPLSPPPVQVPPSQFAKPAAKSSGSVFGFFWDAVAKVQDAHSSLDEYLADWFGLDQSKYQWALNDYYEHSGKEKASVQITKAQQLADKGQTV